MWKNQKIVGEQLGEQLLPNKSLLPENRVFIRRKLLIPSNRARDGVSC